MNALIEALFWLFVSLLGFLMLATYGACRVSGAESRREEAARLSAKAAVLSATLLSSVETGRPSGNSHQRRLARRTVERAAKLRNA